MRPRAWAVGLIPLLLAGCASSGAPTAVRLETKGMAFDRNEIEVEAGRPVRLQLVNSDVVLHDFSVLKIAVKVTKQGHDEHQMHGDEPDLHVSAAAGKSSTIEFTPLEPGTYTFFCTVEGHRESGMVGELIVKAPTK
jgi:uncharacterized cupredoxin-like copper-binding protein